MDQAVALPIGCPSYKQALDLADAWQRWRKGWRARIWHVTLWPVELMRNLRLKVVGAVAAGLHNIASTAVYAIGCPANLIA